ncbi:LOW QUALITY PROTEIN: hypothetical protein HZS_6273 [Henneguya salminicola]|nr:LOW QUALITY PROTEIN: hypothetical protein HZS_6273 [Henneguya salminicola]
MRNNAKCRDCIEDNNFTREINFENDVPSKLKTLHSLVVQYVSQGKYDLALPLCRQVIEDLESTRGHYDADVAVMLYTMALVYRDQKNYKEAIKHLNDSLHIRETIFGREDLTVASTLNNLSVLYGKIKQLDQAEIMCKKALEIRETVLGSSHADVAKQLTNLALIYQYKKKFKEAENCFIRAKNIYETQLGKNDAYSIKTQSNLGLLYVKEEKYYEALKVYEKDRKDLYNRPYDQLGQWHKASNVDRPTINSIFKYLIVTYSKLNEYEKLIMLRSIKQESQSCQKLNKIKYLIKIIRKDENNCDNNLI